MLSRHWLQLHYVRGQSIQSVMRRGEARVESLSLTCFLLKQKFSKNEIFSAWIEKKIDVRVCRRFRNFIPFWFIPMNIILSYIFALSILGSAVIYTPRGYHRSIYFTITIWCSLTGCVHDVESDFSWHVGGDVLATKTTYRYHIY